MTKRPWKQFARIEGVELHSLEEKFEAKQFRTIDENGKRIRLRIPKQLRELPFESPTEAETFLAEWFSGWIRAQVKRRRRVS